MANSVSGQDEPNRALWLATRAGKMERSCPLGTARCILQAKLPQKPYNKSFIDEVCSVKMTGYWASFFFCEFMDLDFVSVHKHAKNIHIAILTSHLVNNLYLYSVCKSEFQGDLWRNILSFFFFSEKLLMSAFLLRSEANYLKTMPGYHHFFLCGFQITHAQIYYLSTVLIWRKNVCTYWHSRIN